MAIVTGYSKERAQIVNLPNSTPGIERINPETSLRSVLAEDQKALPLRQRDSAGLTPAQAAQRAEIVLLFDDLKLADSKKDDSQLIPKALRKQRDMDYFAFIVMKVLDKVRLPDVKVPMNGTKPGTIEISRSLLISSKLNRPSVLDKPVNEEAEGMFIASIGRNTAALLLTGEELLQVRIPTDFRDIVVALQRARTLVGESGLDPSKYSLVYSGATPEKGFGKLQQVAYRLGKVDS